MPAKGRGIVTSGTMSRGTHIAGYELITTAPCPRTSVFRGRGNRLAGTTDDGQPPRPAPITQTAKPVARSPTDLPSGLSYGQGTGLVHVRAAVRVVRIGPPARAGTRPGSIRSSPARKTAIPSELRRVYDVAASWFRGHAASITRSPPVAGGGDNSSGRLVSSERAGQHRVVQL